MQSIIGRKISKYKSENDRDDEINRMLKQFFKFVQVIKEKYGHNERRNKDELNGTSDNKKHNI